MSRKKQTDWLVCSWPGVPTGFLQEGRPEHEAPLDRSGCRAARGNGSRAVHADHPGCPLALGTQDTGKRNAEDGVSRLRSLCVLGCGAERLLAPLTRTR